MLLLIVSDNKILLIIINLSLGVDFITVSVAAEEMSKLFDVYIINDDITECDEILILSISALTCEVVIGRNNTSEVIIRDDDGRRIISDYILLFI